MSTIGKILVTILVIAAFVFFGTLLEALGVRKVFLGFIAIGIVYGLRKMWRREKAESVLQIGEDEHSIAERPNLNANVAESNRKPTADRIFIVALIILVGFMATYIYINNTRPGVKQRTHWVERDDLGFHSNKLPESIEMIERPELNNSEISSKNDDFKCKCCNVGGLIVTSNAQELNLDQDEFERLIRNWNRGHNLSDLDMFELVYSDTVLYYGKMFSKEQCIKSKKRLLSKFKSFTQFFCPDVIFEKSTDKKVRANFNKEAGEFEEMKLYPSYLVFEFQDGEWRITEESDEITDRNLKMKWQ